MKRRLAVAGLGIPLAFGAVFIGGWILVALLSVLGAVGTLEFYRLAAQGGAAPLKRIGLAAAVLFPTIPRLVLDGVDPAWLIFAVTLWFLVVMAVTVWAIAPSRAPLQSVATTVMGPLYTAALPSLLVLIRHGGVGLSAWAATWLVFLPLSMTWICDTFAMTVGSMIGGPKFAPLVSPNKTWSGAVSGLVGAVLVALILGLFVLPRVDVHLAGWQLVVMGLSVGIFGQIGDLAESLFKRSAGVKDSGTFFPGHGGVLDRLDSLYWVIPISAMLLYGFGTFEVAQ